MRGRSVRLTRAVRLAACGKEPEEKLSEWRQQTADKIDLFILAQRNRKRKKENRESKKRSENHTKEEDEDKDIRMMREETNRSSHLCWRKKKYEGTTREMEERETCCWQKQKQQQTDKFHLSYKDRKKSEKQTEKARMGVAKNQKLQEKKTIKQQTFCLICALFSADKVQKWKTKASEKRGEKRGK